MVNFELSCGTTVLSTRSRWGLGFPSKRFDHVPPESDVKVPVYERVKHVVGYKQSMHGQMNV